MHPAILKLFPSVVNPAGQSTAQSCPTWINAPYTLDTYQIHTKLCTWIHLYVLFICAKFQGNASKNCSDFIIQAPPTPWKERRKKTCTHKSLITHDYCKLSKICYAAPPKWLVAITQNFYASEMELWICGKSILVLPINIPMVWCAGLLGHTTHYHVSWYFKHTICGNTLTCIIRVHYTPYDFYYCSLKLLIDTELL